MDAFKNILEQIEKFDDFRDDPERTALLVARMRTGDRDAEWELVLSTLRFVVWLARAHCRRVKALPDLSDLIQEGCKRVLIEIRGFDPAKSSLKDFIRFRVKFAFIDYFYAAKAINKTGYRRQFERIVRRAREKLEEALGREPTVRELAQQLEMGEGKLAAFFAQGVISFVDIGEPEEEDGRARRPMVDPPSDDSTPFDLAKLAETPDIAERCLGRKDAELLLTYIVYGVEAFRDLYFKRKQKQKIGRASCRERVSDIV
jgi:DNA-directed RNA polymerase specialized sigma subunit